MSQLTILADPSETSYVAIVTEWLGTGLPSTEHHVISDVYGRSADDDKEGAMNDNEDTLGDSGHHLRDVENKDVNVFEHGDVMNFNEGRKKYIRRRYLLMQLEDLNNNKIMAPSLKFDQQLITTSGVNEWNVRRDDDDVNDDDDANTLTENIDDDSFGDKIVDEGFVLIDEIEEFDDTTKPTSSSSSPSSSSSTTTTREETSTISSATTTTTMKDVSGNVKITSDDDSKNGEFQHFVITTPEHFADDFQNKTESDTNFSKDDVLRGISKKTHSRDEGNLKILNNSLHQYVDVVGGATLNYEEEMKLLLQADDPSVDHFRFFNLCSEMESETKSYNLTKHADFPITCHNISKKPIISVSKLDLDFPIKTNTAAEGDQNKTELITGNYKSNKENSSDQLSTSKPPLDVLTSFATITTPSTTCKGDSSLPRNFESKLSGFESLVADELTSIMEFGQLEKEIEVEMPDFTFDFHKSKFDENSHKYTKDVKSENEMETNQTEIIRNIYLPDFDFEDSNRDQTHIQTLRETLRDFTKEQSNKDKVKLEKDFQSKILGNITLPSFDFKNLSPQKSETASVSTSNSFVSTSITSNTKDINFERMVQEEMENVLKIGKIEIEKQIAGWNYDAKDQDKKLKSDANDFKKYEIPHSEFDDSNKMTSKDDFDEMKLNEQNEKSDEITDTKKGYKAVYDDITFSSYGFSDSQRTPDIPTPFSSLAKIDGSEVTPELKCFDSMTQKEVNKFIEAGEIEAMKQLENPSLDLELSNPKISKDDKQISTSTNSHFEIFQNINLPDFEFDDKLDLKPKSQEETKIKLFENIFPSFDFQDLNSKKLPEDISFTSTSSVSISETMISKPKDDISGKFQDEKEDTFKEKQIQLSDFDFESSDVRNISFINSRNISFINSRNISKMKETSEGILSTSPTQITTSSITITKVSQPPEKSHPKTSIKLLSRSESNEIGKGTKETSEKHLEFPNFNIELSSSDMDSKCEDSKLKGNKHIELENIIATKHVELPSLDFDSNQLGPHIDNTTNISIVKEIEENEFIPTSFFVATSEFENKIKENPEKEIKDADFGLKDIKMEIPSFDFDDDVDDYTGRFEETESETKVGMENFMNEDIIDDRIINLYVESIMDSASNAINHMQWIEDTNIKSEDNNEDYDEDIEEEVRYAMLKDDDDDDNLKLFKRKVKTDSLGNILQLVEGTEDEEMKQDKNDKTQSEQLEDVPLERAGNHSNRLRQLSRDLKIDSARSPLSSNSSVDIVVTPATPIDYKVITSDDWYGRVGETSLIEEEKMDERKAREESEKHNTSSEDYEPDYDDEDDDKDEARGDDDGVDGSGDEEEEGIISTVLTYDDEDMKLSDDEDEEEKDDDESGTFASYKREVIRISFDDSDDHEGRSRSPSLHEGEDRLQSVLYSPKKRFSMENIETIKEESETVDKSGISTDDVWIPEVNDQEIAMKLFRMSSNFSNVDKHSKEHSSSFFIGNTRLREAVGSKDIPGFEPTTHESTTTITITHDENKVPLNTSASEDISQKVTSGDRNENISSTDVISEVTTQMKEEDDLDVLIPSIGTASSSSSSASTSVRQSPPIKFSQSDNKFLSFVDINVIPASQIPPDVVEDKNWFGNFPDEEPETVGKLQHHDDINFYDTNESETIERKCHSFEIEADKNESDNIRHDSDTSPATNEDIPSHVDSIPATKHVTAISTISSFEGISSPKVSSSSIQNIYTSIKSSGIEPISGDLINQFNPLVKIESLSSPSSSSSYISETSTTSSGKLSNPSATTASSKNNIVTNEIETKPLTKFKEAGDKLLDIVDINVIPASPVPLEVMRDENYFGNTQQDNENETEHHSDEDVNLFESEGEEIESLTKSDIPFFDLEDELSNNSLQLGVKGRKKMVTSFPVDAATSSSSSPGMISKALDMSTEFFNVTLASSSTTTTTSYSSEFKIPSISSTTSKGISSTSKIPEDDRHDDDDHSKETHRGDNDWFTSIDLSSLPFLSTTPTTLLSEVVISTEVKTSKSPTMPTRTTSTISDVVSEIEAKAKPFFDKMKGAGDRLLGIVDINVIPASPVPPEMMKHDNWFGNTNQQNESETKRQDEGAREMRNSQNEKDTEAEIPGFSFGLGEVSNQSIFGVESGGHEKTVTSFPVDPGTSSSSIIDKAIELTSNFFNKSSKAPSSSSQPPISPSSSTTPTQNLIKSEEQFIDHQLWHHPAPPTHYGGREDAKEDHEISDSMISISKRSGLKRKRESDRFTDAVGGYDDDDEERKKSDDDDDDDESKIRSTQIHDYAKEENFDTEKEEQMDKFSDNFKEVTTHGVIDIPSGVATSGISMTSFPGEITHSPPKSKINQKHDSEIDSFEIRDEPKLQDTSSFGFEPKMKISKFLDNETYDEHIKTLDDLIETSKKEMHLIRTSTPTFEIETSHSEKIHHETETETENLLGNVTLESSIAGFRDVSSVMSPGSDVKGSKPMTDKIAFQFPVEFLLDSSALDSSEIGKKKTSRRSLADDWLETSLETYGAKQEQTQEGHPLGGDDTKLIQITGPIRKRITQPDGPSAGESLSDLSIYRSTSSSSSTMTYTKTPTRADVDDDDLDGDDNDDVNLSSRIGWRQQSDESRLKHHKTAELSSTTTTMSEPHSIDKISHDPTQISESKQPITEVHDSSELVNLGIDSSGQSRSGETDSLREKFEMENDKKIDENISKVDDKMRAVTHKDDILLDDVRDENEKVRTKNEAGHSEFKKLHEKNLKDIRKQSLDSTTAVEAANQNETRTKEGHTTFVDVSAEDHENKTEVHSKNLENEGDNTFGSSRNILDGYQTENFEDKTKDILHGHQTDGHDTTTSDVIRGYQAEGKTGVSLKDLLKDEDKEMFGSFDKVTSQSEDHESRSGVSLKDLLESEDRKSSHISQAHHHDEMTKIESGMQKDEDLLHSKSETSSIGLENIHLTIDAIEHEPKVIDELSEQNISKHAEAETLMKSRDHDESHVTKETKHSDVGVENKIKDENEENKEIHLDEAFDKTEILKESKDVNVAFISDESFKQKLEHEVSIIENEQIRKPQDVEVDEIQHDDDLHVSASHQLREGHTESNTESLGNNTSDDNLLDTSTKEEDGIKFNNDIKVEKMSHNVTDERDEKHLVLSEHNVEKDDSTGDAEGPNMSLLETGIVTKTSVAAAEKLGARSPEDRVGRDDSLEMRRSKVGRYEMEDVRGGGDDDLAASAYDELRVLDPNFNSKSAFSSILADRFPVDDTAIIDHTPDGAEGREPQSHGEPSGTDRKDISAGIPLLTRIDGEFVGGQSVASDKNMELRRPRVGQRGIEEMTITDELNEIQHEISTIAICPAREEPEDGQNWKELVIADSRHLVDMKAIEPYMKCVSHGGYYGDGLNAIIVLAACYLPPKSLPHYTYVMDHLFYYIMNVLEVMAVDQYKLVYLHGTMTEAKLPPNKWMKKCYETIDKKLKKRMDQMIVVHPTFWLKTLIFLFASSKFSKKLVYVKSLETMNKILQSQDLHIPDEVLQIDHKLNPSKKRSK